MAMGDRVWEARTGTPPADEMLAYSQSVDEDEPLLAADLAGSVAHALGLLHAGLLEEAEALVLVEGLQSLADEADSGDLELDPELEDVHMNVEAALEQSVGDPAAKLHAGRSRNDQVALDQLIATRHSVAQVAGAAHELAAALAGQAKAHARTPWTMRTHGQPAQPATLGFLFHAHALRFSRDVDALLGVLDEHDTCPLGSAAGAGSTLPLQPAFVADLLGLSPPENALVAAGARDPALSAVHRLAELGHRLEDLAVDLLDLHARGLVEPPRAYTTGSSIMPHKVNPDALELARADGARLKAFPTTFEAAAGGQGLGYDRDLQRAQPPLLEALDTAESTTSVLASVVGGMDVDPEGEPAPPGAATTDAVEALVEHGTPFRQAHQLVAEALADEGTDLEETLADAGVGPEALEAAADALSPDPGRRDTPAGPAPDRVREALADLEARLAGQADELARARHATASYEDLLAEPPKRLVHQAKGADP
jgi:argininosuccinate lyase